MGITPAMNSRVSPLCSFSWALSGCFLYYTHYCPIPIYEYMTITSKESLMLFSATSLYNMYFGMNSRTMVSRIYLLNDGLHIVAVDGVGNATKVPLSETKVEKFHEKLNILEI